MQQKQKIDPIFDQLGIYKHPTIFTNETKMDFNVGQGSNSCIFSVNLT